MNGSSTASQPQGRPAGDELAVREVDGLLAEALDLLVAGKHDGVEGAAARITSARMRLARRAEGAAADLVCEPMAWQQRWEGAARELHLQRGGAAAAWDRHHMTSAAAVLAAAGFRRPPGPAASAVPDSAESTVPVAAPVDTAIEGELLDELCEGAERARRSLHEAAARLRHASGEELEARARVSEAQVIVGGMVDHPLARRSSAAEVAEMADNLVVAMRALREAQGALAGHAGGAEVDDALESVDDMRTALDALSDRA